MSDAGPVAPTERVLAIDVLRGVALLGIFLVNFNDDYFASPISHIDRAAEAAIDFFCEGSFLPVFSFLFGLSFSLQIARLTYNKAPVARIYLRRLAILMLFGMAHAVFLWNTGDILRVFALLGIPLLLVRRLSSRTLLIGVALCLFLTVKSDLVMRLVDRSPGLATALSLHRNIGPALGAAEHHALEAGSYAQLVHIRGEMVLQQMRRLPITPPFYTFAMFIVGLVAGRSGVFAHPTAHLSSFRRLMWAGWLLGLSATCVYMLGPLLARDIDVLPRRLLDFTGVFHLAGDTALGVFYVAVITLLVAYKGSGSQWLGPLAATGRMALTNYLLQSMMMFVLMFHGGLGLAFKVGLGMSIPLRLLLFAAQVGVSAWWMSRYRYGPVEWVWRTATYGSFPPLRAQQTAH